jgi:hypothetical protein
LVHDHSGLTRGNSYLLDFMMADENTFTSIPQEITVDFPTGSSTLPMTFAATMLPTANYWTVWQDQQEVFVATTDTARVRFSANTQYDVGLDYVRVADIPEPNLLILSLCGFLLLVIGKLCQ